MRRYSSARPRSRGFTLVEVIIALGITGLIGVALTGAVYQMLTVPSQASAHMLAVQQVENAVHWLSRDVQQAQVVTPSGDSGFPLTISWTEWDSTNKSITYAIENGELLRTYAASGSEPVTVVVAWHIDADVESSSCQFSGGVFTFQLTARIAAIRPASETRTGRVTPRSVV
jgi:prepilin-type N-terminal cleavage/methylation domain-containing protein